MSSQDYAKNDLENELIENAEKKSSNKERVIEFDQQSYQAVDGGWGWFCVLGSILSHMIIGGLERSSGILYIAFDEKFHKSAALTAWVISLAPTIRLMLGPLASVICGRYSCRASVMVGALILALSNVLAYLMPEFNVLFFTFGVIGGLGRCLSYSPSVIIVGLYFHKKRSLAVGLATGGVGIGMFFMPPLLEFLFQEYGFEGTLLLVGGIALNLCVSAALFRPLSVHEKIISISKKRKRKRDIEMVDLLSNGKVTVNSETVDEHKHKTIEYKKEVDQSGCDLGKEINQSECDLGKDINQSECNLDTEISQSGDDLANGKTELLSCNKELACMQTINPDDNCCNNNEKSIKGHERSSIFTTIINCVKCKSTNAKDQGKNKHPLFELSLLKDPCFTLYCISIFAFMIALQSGLVFIPALAMEKGVSDIHAAYLLSIMGVADAIGRMGAGIIFDNPRVRKYRRYIYNVVVIFISIISFICPSLSSFLGFAIAVSFFGLLSGSYISQKSVVIVDILGPEKLVNSFGILLLFQGLGVLVGPPVSGLLKDKFGQFDLSFYFCGAVLILSAVVFMCGNIIHIMKQRKARRLKAEQT